MPPERQFTGFDGYKQAIDSGPDVVILATPPGFRPLHFDAAVKAGKHVFMEKPVAVDPAGVRKVLAATEESKKKNLLVQVGLQRRHEAKYIETVKAIHDGVIGDIILARAYWNGQTPWVRPRKANMTELEYQMRNWYYFNWICGDHIVEQHIHNLDVINWVMKGHPTKVVGQGGRIGRRSGNPNAVGHIYDLFALEYEYPGGIPMYSFCSHVPGTTGDVSETVFGTKASSRVNAYMIGKTKVADRDPVDPYVQEHVDLIRSIRAGKPLNALQTVTESTMTAILGRTAAYTGKEVKWDDMLKSQVDTMPHPLTMSMALDVPPVPVPGKTKV